MLMLSHNSVIYKIALCSGLGEPLRDLCLSLFPGPPHSGPFLSCSVIYCPVNKRAKKSWKQKAVFWSRTRSFKPANGFWATYWGATVWSSPCIHSTLGDREEEKEKRKCIRQQISPKMRECVTVTMPFRKVLNLAHSGSTNSLMCTVWKM